MDKELFTMLGQWGAMGVLAAFIFITYDRMVKKLAADNKGREETLIAIVTNNTAAMTKNTASVEANTDATNELRRDLQSLSLGLVRSEQWKPADVRRSPGEHR